MFERGFILPVAAIMLVGASPEPFLSISLECLADAVDCLVINDNSNVSSHQNLQEIYRSKLYREGKIQLVFSEFLGFGACRNLCMDRLRELNIDENWWVMIVDSDEVHPPEKIVPLTRFILPELEQETGIVDGYFYDFFQSPSYYQAFNHRHNMLFRYRKDIHWLQAVHEQLLNLDGKRLVLPYCFFHYGYMKQMDAIREKWRLYGRLGDSISGSQAEQMDSTIEKVAQECWRFYGQHPDSVIKNLQNGNVQRFSENLGFVRLTTNQPLLTIRSKIKRMLIAFKMSVLYFRASLRYQKTNKVLKGLRAIR